MIKLFERKRPRDERGERNQITNLLMSHRMLVEGAILLQTERNKVYQSQGIPSPHLDVCTSCLSKGKMNTEALAEAIAYKPQGVERVISWLGDTHASKLVTTLEKLPHTYRTSEREGEPSDARMLTPLQRVRAHLLLEALEEPGFVAEIGDVIERNPKDGSTELGGFVIPDSARMRVGLYEVSSASSSSRAYAWSSRTLMNIPHIALFHLHALDEDCSSYAGPSWEDLRGNDMMTSHTHASHLGESHDVVFTKLPGRSFNVDYYAHQRVLESKRIFESAGCVDLGNYSY